MKDKKETNPAVLLGKMSWASRTKGKTPEQIKEMMSNLKKGKKKSCNLTFLKQSGLC